MAPLRTRKAKGLVLVQSHLVLCRGPQDPKSLLKEVLTQLLDVEQRAKRVVEVPW